MATAGVTLALPLLDAMIPARTLLAQTAAKPTPRLGFIYVPHGAIMDKWTPATEGAGFEFTPILKPVEPFRALTAQLCDRWPEAPPYGGAYPEVVPHLTVAQGADATTFARIALSAESYARNWKRFAAGLKQIG